MSPSADPPFESQPQGISLDELTQAFAQVMGVEPRRTAGSAAADEPREPSADTAGVVEAAAATEPGEMAATLEPAADDACPICPRTILEAMLFVGNRDGQPN
jgi:hypothetical protein